MNDGLWQRVIGHNRHVEHLRSRLQSGTLAQAYLFAGPEGIGKATLAAVAAAAAVCSSGGCGECSSCRKAMQGEHPDIVTVAPAAGEIKLEAIEDLRRSLRLRHQGRRVCVIDGAHAMNAVAANSLLKTLEEPPAGTCFILITSRDDLLLETIISRCLVLRFAPLDTEAVRSVIAGKLESGADTELYARLSGGSPRTALEMASLPEIRALREFAARILRSLPGSSVIGLEKTASEFAAWADDFVQSAEAGEAQTGAQTRGRHPATRRRQLHHLSQRCYDQLLMFIVLLLRDAILVEKRVATDLLFNVDFADKLPLSLAGGGVATIREMVRETERARARIAAYVSPRLCLEALLFNFREVVAKRCPELSA